NTRKLFRVDHKVLHEVSAVELDGTPLAPGEYCLDLVEGWISLATPPGAGVTLSVRYTYSEDLDLTVTGGRVYQFENRRYTKPPGDGVNILLVLDQQLGANYDINDASNSIIEQLQGFGWNVFTTGLMETIPRCSYSAGVGLGPQTVDYLIPDIPNIAAYDILCLLPGSSGLPNIYSSPEALSLINDAVDSGVIVAAWCKTVRVLAAADLIDGLNVVGHADYAAEYTAAGATYLGNDHPPVIQGKIITSVRSRFYRTEMCEAMRDVLPPDILGVQHYPEEPSDHDSIVITSRACDFAGLELVTAQVDTGDGFFPVVMFDDGMHGDGPAGDSVYGVALPPLSHGTTARYYIEITDSVGQSAIEPLDAPVSYYSVTAFGCCTGERGNVVLVPGCDNADQSVDVSDLTNLIDHLFIGFADYCCLEEVDLSPLPPGLPDGVVDVGDLTGMIDHLFISFPALPPCR
ncbi:MAG: DJ-1/PfpI family protein, partial [candidate division Zixibacteria bacterium]|nr:DJ-1/PfpI family protein [candidate division Zixibacteria bacterium]